ncbi:hypothetical protein MCC93_17380 [Morococcus cerebrosus]|uniref:Uncharacterized protein n=1 Tax=Morococcus cerebrosus TaxID=1056807 RepID=A0A0C1E4G8_9NEIS|nr:hypothetical protein MCC93_17380 [Morococcus cerebrosus]KJJ10799.1 hypothetical protein HMPREF3156_02724 [Neisseria sp. HMSC06F02]
MTVLKSSNNLIIFCKKGRLKISDDLFSFHQQPSGINPAF